MVPRGEIHAVRAAAQRTAESRSTPKERNKLGQFPTPPVLASQIIEAALSHVPPGARIRFLEPGFGTGAFFAALSFGVEEEKLETAVGIEADVHYAQAAKAIWSGYPISIGQADFCFAAPPATEAERFNLLVCNPPYVRHHHLSVEQKVALRHHSSEAAGVNLSGLAGLYCHFMCIAHAWLAEGGVAAWLVPSEFMDVNYGVEVKRYLLERVTLLRVHRFDPEDVQFADALVSSAVVIFRKRKPSAGNTIEFSFGGSLQQPVRSSKVSRTEISASAKWTSRPGRPHEKAVVHRLGDFFSIKRGIATGHNNFFILNEDRVRELRLPRQFLRPILPSPRHLDMDEIRADADGCPVIEKRLFLLNCKLPESDAREFPNLWKYLSEGAALGISQRYLCQHRKPWYAQEDRPSTPFLCTYIGRNNTKRGRPFRFILNHSRATAANVYLLLYPKEPLASAVAKRPEVKRQIFEFLNAISTASLISEGRVYGGGLHKLEPKELMNVPADRLGEIIDPKGLREGQMVLELRDGVSAADARSHRQRHAFS